MTGLAAVTVLGVGNPIMGDDAVGLELLAAVRAARPDPRVDYLDGGTGGMELLPDVEDAERLLILDAVAGTAPGAVAHVRGDQISRLLSIRLSPHQVGLLDVLAAARLLGREPAVLEVVGITPGSVELRLGLTPEVAGAVDAAAALAVEVLDRWLAEAAAG
jgi:hydrogenase maturation protease